MFFEHRSQPVSFVRKVGEFLSVSVFFRAVHDQCFLVAEDSRTPSQKKTFLMQKSARASALPQLVQFG